ncbi:erythromycin esterase family protein [Brevundimonas sp. AAP58]|uniref:erythromycin esterase family protein n=1 Tax=Brevundimonas sp. AAP58 TaxID=1523422 RepID=UPI0012E206E7|nr:erythromycin esterase family protein [Brevundimonas sp. AAP58]
MTVVMKIFGRVFLIVLVAGAVLGVGWSVFDGVQRAKVEAAVRPWISENAVAFDPDTPDSLWSPELARVLGGARLIGVGEATHGSHEDGAAKAAIIKGLVTSGAVDTVILEVNANGGRELDAFIRGESGDPAERVRTANIFRVNKTSALADLIGWLRDWNRTAANPVRIYGIDCQATSPDALLAHQALTRLEPAEAQRLAPPLSPILSSEAQALRFPMLIKSLTSAQLQEAMAALVELRRALERHPGTEDARYAALTAWQGLKAFELETSDGRITGDAAAIADYYSRRDVFMAENILNGPAQGAGVFWAHNNHVAGGVPAGTGYVPTGARLREALGDAYRVVVTEYGTARFNAVPMWLPFPQPSASDAQSEITWTVLHGRPAALFSRAHSGPYWVALSDLPDTEASAAWRALPYTLDWPGWVATPVQFLKAPFRVPLGEMFDVVVYIPEMTPSRPV